MWVDQQDANKEAMATKLGIPKNHHANFILFLMHNKIGFDSS
jgi:hypothetical protein